MPRLVRSPPGSRELRLLQAEAADLRCQLCAAEEAAARASSCAAANAQRAAAAEEREACLRGQLDAGSAELVSVRAQAAAAAEARQQAAQLRRMVVEQQRERDAAHGARGARRTLGGVVALSTRQTPQPLVSQLSATSWVTAGLAEAQQLQLEAALEQLARLHAQRLAARQRHSVLKAAAARLGSALAAVLGQQQSRGSATGVLAQLQGVQALLGEL